jgi:hypothetical protein
VAGGVGIAVHGDDLRGGGIASGEMDVGCSIQVIVGSSIALGKNVRQM